MFYFPVHGVLYFASYYVLSDVLLARLVLPKRLGYLLLFFGMLIEQ